jgi:hypothetical protein
MGENDAVAPVGAPIGGITERNPNSLANLRPPWQKGQSDNPSGRPRGLFPSRVRRALRKVIGRDEEGSPVYLVDELVDAAIRNPKDLMGFKFPEFLAEQADGPVALQEERAKPDSGPAIINVVTGVPSRRGPQP